MGCGPDQYSFPAGKSPGWKKLFAHLRFSGPKSIEKIVKI